jgi:hypothetical protein
LNTTAEAAKCDCAMRRSVLVHLAHAGALLLAEAKVTLEEQKKPEETPALYTTLADCSLGTSVRFLPNRRESPGWAKPCL